jgi:hypothetical protein
MNLDRGFRCLALAVSVVGVAFALVVTGYDTYKTVLHVRFRNEWGQCLKQAEQWVPSPGDETSPGEWVPERIAAIPLNHLPSRIDYARSYLAYLCDDHFSGPAGLPAHLDRAIESWDSTFLVPLWPKAPARTLMYSARSAEQQRPGSKAKHPYR